MGVQPESVWFCGVFTLKAVNEFKMVSGLCQQPHHQRVRLPVKSQRCNWPLITARIYACFLWPYIQWAYGLNVCHQTRNQICSTVGCAHKTCQTVLSIQQVTVLLGETSRGSQLGRLDKPLVPSEFSKDDQFAPSSTTDDITLGLTGSGITGQFREPKISDTWGKGVSLGCIGRLTIQKNGSGISA